ncbi:NirD/YgiW/YdeI family stress tolerance protein [bacterium]|nr:NirD/YgiW/YdeI family stress tolerance protein [bacterium]
MKKIFLSLFLLLLCVGFAQNFGFNSKTAKTSIKDVLKLPNNTNVTVEGKIIKKLSSDKYLFKDQTGQITVEIDDDKWQNLTVNENDTLELTGEFEKKLNSQKIDVDIVKKVEKTK